MNYDNEHNDDNDDDDDVDDDPCLHLLQHHAPQAALHIHLLQTNMTMMTMMMLLMIMKLVIMMMVIGYLKVIDNILNCVSSGLFTASTRILWHCLLSPLSENLAWINLSAGRV